MTTSLKKECGGRTVLRKGELDEFKAMLRLCPLTHEQMKMVCAAIEKFRCEHPYEFVKVMAEESKKHRKNLRRFFSWFNRLRKEGERRRLP